METGLTRRAFVQQSATGVAVTIGAAGAMSATAQDGKDSPSEFRSAWQNAFDRVWLGESYWANPLQDWRIAGGRIECVKAAPNRNVHLLTRQLGEKPGELRMSVRLGRMGGGALGEGAGSAGFSIGVLGPLAEYRNNLIFGRGLDAGLTSDGRLFVGDERSPAGKLELRRESVELRLAAAPAGGAYRVTLAAHDGESVELLGELAREGVPAERLIGNLALAVNFAASAPGGAKKANPAAAKRAANQSPAGEPGRFWFSDWRVGGSKVEVHDDRSFGPILFSQYTVSRGVLKLTAQMPPLGEQDASTIALQLQKNGKWTHAAIAEIDPEARTATFRVERWDATQDAKYRLAYSERFADGTTKDHRWEGLIRRDPVDAPVLTVADISCNIHAAFPNTLYTQNVAKLNPDFLAFVGDQFYESSGGYGVERGPLSAAILDYLRKWYMHGWTWRELTRDRPSISIPDDHDVYQGNLWGEGGIAAENAIEEGGYNMPAAWVNVVHRTQTSHHPDPWDATPGAQGVSVYAGPLTWGRVSFAILADRQFKSGPQGKVPPTGGRADHVIDPNYDPHSADLPGLQLLGERQLDFLREWAADWRGADMKSVISQTIFTAMATTHGGERQRLVADYDANGWPQSERNAALREIRKAFAFHVAGDQHLPAVIHYGIDEHGDCGLAFAGPPVNCGYPRWFEPREPGGNRAPGAPENTGDFRDSFGHPLTVLAVVNGAVNPRRGVLEQLHDKASGLGLVRFDKEARKIIIQCWPLLADVTRDTEQFPGWPVTIDVQDNYGRKATAQLPTLEIEGIQDPVVQVIEEATGELVYSLRIAGSRRQPHVFAVGKYTVKVGDPDSNRWKELPGLEATPQNGETVRVRV